MGVDLIGVDLAAASIGSAGFQIPLRSGQIFQRNDPIRDRERMLIARRLTRETFRSLITLEVSYRSPSHLAQVPRRAVGMSSRPSRNALRAQKRAHFSARMRHTPHDPASSNPVVGRCSRRAPIAEARNKPIKKLI